MPRHLPGSLRPQHQAATSAWGVHGLMLFRDPNLTVGLYYQEMAEIYGDKIYGVSHTVTG